MKYKYSVKKPYSITYYIIIFVCILLTIGRWYSLLNPGFVVINAEIHSHISNLYLTLVAYVGIGYSWLLYGMKFGRIQILGICLIAENFVCEIFMGFMNTTDIIDALYGSAGVLIAYTYLFITNKYGLVEVIKEEIR